MLALLSSPIEDALLREWAGPQLRQATNDDHHRVGSNGLSSHTEYGQKGRSLKSTSVPVCLLSKQLQAPSSGYHAFPAVTDRQNHGKLSQMETSPNTLGSRGKVIQLGRWLWSAT